MRNEFTNLSVVVKFIFFLLQHKKEYMVEWRPSWVAEEQLDRSIVSGWKKKKKK